MSKYKQIQTAGEFWLRDAKGNKETAALMLSSVYQKYQSAYPIFYSELSSNLVSRFDVFYDSIFVETKSGCIFEKIYTEENSIKPFNLSNQFTAKHDPVPRYLAFNTFVDYWFEETERKVYFASVVGLEENKNFPKIFSFALIVNVFDCLTGIIRTVLFDKVGLVLKSTKEWDIYDYILENPKLTRNTTTGVFNVSFLLKNVSRQFGLISINFSPGATVLKDQFEITEINGHLPFFEIDENESYCYAYDPNLPQNYRILTVATDSSDPAYNLKFIILKSQDEEGNWIESSLAAE